MNPPRENALRALRRMLANGPLTALPKRSDDQALLLQLAASRLEPDRTYSEREVNEALEGWLGTFCSPCGIDHVTLRRLMVDSRLLARDKSGSAYRVNPDSIDVPKADPAQVLAEIMFEREARKRDRATGGR